MVCRVPVRCFYATVDSFAARKLVLVNNNPGSNPPQHQQPTTTHGNPVSIAVSEDLVNLYENDLDKLYDGQTNRKVRLAGLIPVTLLAQSASLAFELSQFSPFLGKIRTDRIAQQPLESRKGLCRDVIFYGNGFENDESLAEVATIYNSPNNEIYYRLPPSMKTLQMNTFSYLETPNALSWLLLRHLCKYGLCNGEKVPVFQPYLYERAEKRHLINYMENFDSAGPTLTKESSRSPSSSSPPPTGLFDTIDGGGGAGSSGARANQDRPRSLGRGKVVAPIPIMATMATAASYATIARAAPKPPAPLPAIPQPHLRRSVDFFTFYAAYRPLNIKRFGEIVGCMPRFKYADDARRFSKESDFVDMVKNRVVIRDAAIRNTLDPTNKTTISAEYTRIWLTSTSSYWAVSSVTVAITPTQWSLHYGKNAPLPTVESTGKCACGDEQCYPSNFMGFEEGIAYAQKQQQQQHTW